MPPLPVSASSSTLSVAIVSWNVREALRECLAAVRAEGSAWVREVFVVENASGDGTPEMVSSGYPEVRLIRNEENAGFARGCNQALREMAGEYACLLNPDTRVCPGALGTLAGFLA